MYQRSNFSKRPEVGEQVRSTNGKALGNIKSVLYRSGNNFFVRVEGAGICEIFDDYFFWIACNSHLEFHAGGGDAKHNLN